MKPREFLSERDYPLMLALTYSLDPVFFERLVLPALWSGGTDNILVLADGQEVDRVLQRPHGDLHHLGRRYLLSPIRRRGAFHPKLVVRFGRESGAVWLSTGNLTHGGWGLNQEVASAWQFGPEHEDPGDWVRPLLRSASAWADAPLADRMLEHMEDLPWLPAEVGPAPRLLLNGEATLAQQLSARWAGRRFERLRFLTGSTDTDGEVLGWFARTFGVAEVVGALTPSRCAWSPERVAALPVDMRLTAHTAPIVHAKAYHLSGPDGDVLVIGSANCTPSAWLRPAEAGGNIEAVLIYEGPIPEDLDFLNAAIGEAPGSLESVLLNRDVEPEEPRVPPTPVLRIRSFQIEEDGGVALDLDGVPDERSVVLVLPGEEIPLLQEGGHWMGRGPDTLPPGQTAFAHVEARADGEAPLASNRRWADDLRLLHQSGGVRRLGRALHDLTRPATEREDNKLLQELSQLAHDLIHDARALRDPFTVRSRKEDREAKAPPVDPESLIRSLRDVAVPVIRPTESGPGGQTLGGIFRALFGEGEAESEGQEIGVDDQDLEWVEDSEETARATDPEDLDPGAPVAERVRKRFEQHLRRFMKELRSETFRQRCTATQLVQAVGYPFAAVALGLLRGWTDQERSREWLVASANALLRQGPEGEPPLLVLVRDRYEEGDSLPIFERIVGDGTLWVVVTIGLISLSWPGPVGPLERMLFLRDLWAADILRAHVDTERLEGLVRRYRASDAVRVVRELAAPLIAAATTLETRLRHLCETADLARTWADLRRPVEAGEPLWGYVNDWALPLEPEKDGKVRIFWPKRAKEARMVLKGYFVSIPQVAELDSEVAAAYERLLDVWMLHAPGQSRQGEPVGIGEVDRFDLHLAQSV